MNPIEQRLKQVHSRIEQAASACGRDPADVTLIAVSKTRPVEDLAAAYAVGQRAFGESYLQEAEDKILALSALDIEWHYIGRIQSNKTRPIASLFDWVHGLDDPKHARRLNEQRPEGRKPLAVCLQVNLSGERSKGGVAPEDVEQLARDVSSLPNLSLRGLMTLPAPSDDPAQQRVVFQQLRQLLEQLNQRGFELDSLSMGMSGDLEAAVCEGATMVRIGTAIFGPRR